MTSIEMEQRLAAVTTLRNYLKTVAGKQAKEYA